MWFYVVNVFIHRDPISDLLSHFLTKFLKYLYFFKSLFNQFKGCVLHNFVKHYKSILKNMCSIFGLNFISKDGAVYLFLNTPKTSLCNCGYSIYIS